MANSLEEFRRDPKTFLRTTPVSIRCLPRDTFGTRQGAHYYRWDNSDPTNRVRITPLKSCPIGQIFRAYTVPVTEQSDFQMGTVPSVNPVTDILVTTSLNACSFVWRYGDTGINVGHAKPTKDGFELQRSLSNQYGYGSVYGKSDFLRRGEAATVIGVFDWNEAKWHIYAQVYCADGRPVKVDVLL